MAKADLDARAKAHLGFSRWWLVTVVGWQTTFQVGAGLALVSAVATLALRPPTESTARGSPSGTVASED